MNRLRVEPPPLWLAAYAVVLVIWLLGLYLPLFFGGFPKPIDSLDFSYYYAGARIGIEHGWSHIYDLNLQRQVFYQLHPAGDVFDWRRYFVSPPPVAWLVAPFTALPLVPAFWTFAGLSTIAFIASAWLATPGRGLRRVLLLVTAACIYPLLIAVQTGQVTPLIAAATMLGWWLAKRGRPTLAGLVLVALVLKPQVAILLTPALLIAGQRRLFVTWFAGAALVSAIAIASLGATGLDQLRAAITAEQGQPATLAWTLAGLVGPGAVAGSLEIACGCLGLIVAWWHRGRSLELVIVAGSLGTLLASPYHNPSDFAILAPAAWLYLRGEVPAWHRAWLVIGLLATYLAAGFGPGMLLVFTAGWLVLMFANALRMMVADDRASVPGPTEAVSAQQ